MEERTHNGQELRSLQEAENAAEAQEMRTESRDLRTEAQDAAGSPVSCMICDRPRTEGIHICEAFICEDCEREMVATEVGDAKYPYFIMRMRQIWYRLNA